MKIVAPNARRRRRIFFLFACSGLLGVANFLPPPLLAQENAIDFYEQGLAQKQAGAWKKALEIWAAGRRALNQEGRTDPRLGIAFIELATQKQAKEYYAAACQIYLWGFSEKNFLNYKKEVQQEIERIAPLLSAKRYADWSLSLSQNDFSLGNAIKGFWIAKDPTPRTEINERLLEHWERVAYARQHFTKAANAVYGTDDRGLIYVKFGAPGRSKKGILGTKKDEFRTWIAASDAPDAANIFEIERQVNSFNTLPEYELWRYASLPTDEPIIYLFGNKDGTGAFGLRSGIEDFIPARAFSKTSTRYTNGFLPGAVLQMMFYAEVRTFDPFFERRYRDLESIWAKARADNPFDPRSSVSPNHNTLRGITAHYESRDEDQVDQKQAPLDRSSYEANLIPINLMPHQTRLLNDKDQPVLVVTAFSFLDHLPRENIKEKKTSIYQLTHTLIVRDRHWREMARYVDSPPVSFDNTSCFMLEHKAAQAHYTIAAEAFGLLDNPHPDTLMELPPLAIGKSTIASPPPLAGDPAKLELSDLVIGVAMPAGVDSALFPFHLIPAGQIWRNEALKCYLEIYHLVLNAEQQAQFVIDFRVTHLERKGGKIKRKEMMAMSFSFEHPARRAQENFDIDISNLKPGAYELIAEVTDKISLQKKQRAVTIQMTE